jgi:hypothetical protein
VHEALGGAFPKRHHVDCGLIAIICKVPILVVTINRANLSLKKSRSGAALEPAPLHYIKNVLIQSFFPSKSNNIDLQADT